MISKSLLLASLAACWLAALSVVAQTSSPPPGPSYEQLLQAAQTARTQDRDDEAIRLFRRALSEQPESEEALWYLATLFYEKQQYADARDALRQFMTLRSDASPGWALLGICEFQLKEYPRALNHRRRAMTEGIGDRKELAKPMLYDLMVLLTRFERYDESQALLAFGEPDASLVEPAGLSGLRLPFLPTEIPPDKRELVRMAGSAVLAVQAEQYEQAESGFKQLVAAYPNEPGVHFLYGAYLAQRHPEQASPEFQRELEISPFHVLARVRLAEQLVDQRDFEHALDMAQQAIQLDPKRASAHAFAGEALIGMGRTPEGTRELELARTEDPTVSRVHWDLMRAYASSGRKDDARREKEEMEKLLRPESQSGPVNPSESSHGPSGR
jgi:tetratricopeptide (TPR) repeat protein